MTRSSYKMLIDNTLFLRERFPSLRKKYSEYEDSLDTKKLEVLDSKSGAKTIKYDQKLMVHSLYDPIREAERIIASHEDKISADTHVFFYGGGLGYHIEKFVEKYPNNPFSIYEPIPEIFKVMSEQRILSSVMTKNTANVYIDYRQNESLELMDEFSSSNKNIHIIVLPSYENIANQQVRFFQETVKSIIIGRRSNLRTNARFQKLWVMNSLFNIKEVLSTPNVMKHVDHNEFKDKPALIVSAGPSLSQDIEYIKYIKENNLAYIFSAGSAINSLVAHDILPDVICTYDPLQTNDKVFKDLIDKNISHLPMLFGSSVGYETLNKYKGPKVHFITTQDRASTYFLREQLDTKRDYILDSPSIAIMIFQVLNRLGVNPIIFAGQNLGFLYDRYYSEEIDYEVIKDKKQLENAIMIEDVYGNEIKTSIGLNNMREILEQFAGHFNGTFINTTKGGAKIKGIPFQPIEEILEKLLTKPITKSEWWMDTPLYDQKEMEKKIKNLYDSIGKFFGLLREGERLMDAIKANIKVRNKQIMQRLLSQFDHLYTQMRQNEYYANFLSFYIRVDTQFLANEIKRLNGFKDSFDKGEGLLRVFSNYINQCRAGSSELEGIIEQALK
jgi:hypothetical protein